MQSRHMKQGIRSRTDPTELEIELALRPGVFISYSEGSSFVINLEEVTAKVRKLVATEPGRAVRLYETFFAGCHAKADEIDDSDGSFRQFARRSEVTSSLLLPFCPGSTSPRLTALPSGVIAHNT